MKILHYALGFPPYRSGGLTKFCVDLMVQQAKEGKKVAMLWPGQMGFVKKKTKVKDRGDVFLKHQKVKSYEIINPLPVSLDEGINDFSIFTADADKKIYSEFLKKYKPDVIHVHTLMGLHKSFLEAAKEQDIHLVFTTHDFFPICPKVTMFHKGTICEHIEDCSECNACNVTALGLNKIRILQSPIYRFMKDTFIVKKLRKQHRDNYLSDNNVDNDAISVGTLEDYKRLREYYRLMLELMDIIHYNSSVTKNVYESVYGELNNAVIGITHSDIKDNRHLKKFSNDKFRIRYLGPQSDAKGFFVLKKALDELWKEQQNFSLDVHFKPIEKSEYMKVHGRYVYKDLKDIFDETDVLVAPSIGYETFGFTVLEAISYGVPVVINGNVGAKDILVNRAGIVIDEFDSEKVKTIFKNLTVKQLQNMNKVIVEKQQIMQIEDMSKQIEKICYII